MKKTVYIHTNNKQRIGGIVAKYAIERYLTDKEIKVEIINVDELPVFKNFAWTEYLRKGKLIKYDPSDLQSFTLSRFMPPELNNFEGRAIVIDPDIFALQDISPFMNMNMEEKAVALCSKKDAFDSSVMLMDCSKLKHWKIENILTELKNKTLDYAEQMEVRREPKENIKIIPRIYNNLDVLTPDTIFIHTTNRITQPWSTGLPIDFTRNDPGKFFGIIPKLPILKLIGKWPTTYQPHPDKEVEKFFFKLVKDCINSGALSKEDVQKEIEVSRMRKDIFEKLETV